MIQLDEKLVIAAKDYDIVCRAIEYMSKNALTQPEVEKISAHLGVTSQELHSIFKRWCGLTPNSFLQAVTYNSAKGIIKKESSLFNTALEVGLSGSSRLHDLFVSHEALSPGEYKNNGEGVEMRYGFLPTPFGKGIFVVTPRGLAGLGFDESQEEALKDMRSRWKNAKLIEDIDAVLPYAMHIFGSERMNSPLKIVLIGTDFEVEVWQALLKVPFGGYTTYGTLAKEVNRPKAARAVGAAVGKNPISFVVPCHRAVGASGALTGYHWGLTRKQAMLGWERGGV